MSNVFQDISPDDKLPEDVRQQTLSNLYTLRLVLDVMDLFVVKAGATLGESLSQAGATQAADQQQGRSVP